MAYVVYNTLNPSEFTDHASLADATYEFWYCNKTGVHHYSDCKWQIATPAMWTKIQNGVDISSESPEARAVAPFGWSKTGGSYYAWQRLAGKRA